MWVPFLVPDVNYGGHVEDKACLVSTFGKCWNERISRCKHSAPPQQCFVETQGVASLQSKTSQVLKTCEV